jgi:hypothetical protein
MEGTGLWCCWWRALWVCCQHADYRGVVMS